MNFMEKIYLCHICLLPIPTTIVSKSHPLFGTRDHVIPKCKGGLRLKGNLAPAHFYCNQKKGHGYVTIGLMLGCAKQIKVELERIGMQYNNPSKNTFAHMHSMIEYLCLQNASLEAELTELYRERGFCR